MKVFFSCKALTACFFFMIVFQLTACVFQSRELFTTHQQENQYDWTLTSRLGQALDAAEKKYGKRDLSWTILGVEIYDKTYPRTFYRNGLSDRKQIIIQLSRLSTMNRKAALFELSHEVLHLLSPGQENNTVSVFEEGLAVYFSIHYLNSIGIHMNPDKDIKDEKYLAAYQHVVRLYTTVSPLEENIVDKKIEDLRMACSGFSSIPASRFQSSFPGFEPDYYKTLAGNFIGYKHKQLKE